MSNALFMAKLELARLERMVEGQRQLVERLKVQRELYSLDNLPPLPVGSGPEPITEEVLHG